MGKLVDDNIPNIQFNVAKSYAILIDALRRLPEEGTLIELEKSEQPATPSPRGEELIKQQILPKLRDLLKEKDDDVRYFATTALGTESEAMQTSP